MKTIYYFTLLFSLILISCESNPVAHFTADTNNPVVGQEVFFSNTSSDADRFQWDFGDGYTSEVKHPSHVYNATGAFEVSMTAIGKNGIDDKATMSINVVIPTLLEIEVREYYDQYVVPNASVILYPTLPDWDAQTNKITEGFTDKNGIVVFSNLDPYVYYADVWEAEHDNYALRNEDVGFVRTQEVLPNQINRFVAWVDYVNHGKGAAQGARSLTIKKLDRVVSMKNRFVAHPDTIGWRELYNRSIKKK